MYMWKLKSKIEICKLPSTTPVFLPRHREARKLPPIPRWSPLQGIPRKGPSSRSGNSVDSLGPSPRVSGSLTCLPASLSRMLPTVFTIKLSAETSRALFPPVHGGGHTTNSVGVISQDLKPPPMYNNGARKHRVVRGMQTSLNTRPKPRASA